MHTHTHTHTYEHTHTHGSDAISPSQQVARGDKTCIKNKNNSHQNLHVAMQLILPKKLQKKLQKKQQLYFAQFCISLFGGNVGYAVDLSRVINPLI